MANIGGANPDIQRQDLIEGKVEHEHFPFLCIRDLGAARFSTMSVGMLTDRE